MLSTKRELCRSDSLSNSYFCFHLNFLKILYPAFGSNVPYHGTVPSAVNAMKWKGEFFFYVLMCWWSDKRWSLLGRRVLKRVYVLSWTSPIGRVKRWQLRFYVFDSFDVPFSANICCRPSQVAVLEREVVGLRDTVFELSLRLASSPGPGGTVFSLDESSFFTPSPEPSNRRIDLEVRITRFKSCLFFFALDSLLAMMKVAS